MENTGKNDGYDEIVLLDENGERVFSDEDQEQVSKIYGPVHSRLLAQALNLGMSQEEAGKQ